jgi:hypothetical protein
MNEKLKKLAGQLYEVLETPVSIKILELLSDKQLNYLYYQYTIIKHAEKMETDTGEKLWDDDKSEALRIIKTVFDFSKLKFKPRSYSDKTNFYLANKLK